MNGNEPIGLQVEIHRPLHPPLDQGMSLPRPVGEAAGTLHHRGHQLIARHDRRDQSQLPGFFHRQRFAGQGQLGGLAQAEHPGEKEQAARVWNQADPNECHDQLRAGRRDPQVTGQRQAQAGARCDAVQCRDHQLGAGADRPRQRDVVLPKVPADVGVAGIEPGADILEIRPGAECAARAGQNDRADRPIAAGRLDASSECLHRGRVESVQGVGPVDGQGQDRAVARAQDGVGHRPRKRPGRFSRKARMPSRLSSDANSR